MNIDNRVRFGVPDLAGGRVARMHYHDTATVVAAGDRFVYVALIEIVVEPQRPSPVEEGLVMSLSLAARYALRCRHSLS